MATRLLMLRDVTAMTALSRSAVYALMAESRFPKPIRIGSRAVRWVETLRQQGEQQAVQVEALQQQVERLAGQMTRLAADYRTLAATLRGRWN